VTERLPDKTVGYCAARLADKLGKPVILVSVRGGTGTGEARGPKGVDLVAALRAHQDYFIDFGGHKQAAGFSIETPKIGELTRKLADYLEAHVDPAAIKKKIMIDSKISVEELSAVNLKSLLCLEPFGEQNRRPVFLLESLRRSMLKEIDGTRRIGDAVLTGESPTLDSGQDSGETVNMVVSPFGDGSLRAVEVIDWARTR
jgi:single-stranded DNA-specific DHH superfamily exonuclease